MYVCQYLFSATWVCQSVEFEERCAATFWPKRALLSKPAIGTDFDVYKLCKPHCTLNAASAVPASLADQACGVCEQLTHGGTDVLNLPTREDEWTTKTQVKKASS